VSTITLFFIKNITAALDDFQSERLAKITALHSYVRGIAGRKRSNTRTEKFQSPAIIASFVTFGKVSESVQLS